VPSVGSVPRGCSAAPSSPTASRKSFQTAVRTSASMEFPPLTPRLAPLPSSADVPSPAGAVGPGRLAGLECWARSSAVPPPARVFAGAETATGEGDGG